VFSLAFFYLFLPFSPPRSPPMHGDFAPAEHKHVVCVLEGRVREQ
jgi:hypothetical protein